MAASPARAYPSPRLPALRLEEELAAARAHTDALFALVQREALHDRPLSSRHRLVFYVGHLEAFDWNLIGASVFGRGAVDPALDRMFAFGIDPLGGNLPTDAAGDWPRMTEVERYVRRARERLDDVLASAEWPDRAQPLPADGSVLHVALEHRWMHAETLAYLLHELPRERKVPPPGYSPGAASGAGASSVRRPPVSRIVEIPAGAATLGLTPELGAPFGWDNELAPHVVSVPAFAIDRHPVTNREFLEFVLAGGYEDRALWSDEDRFSLAQRGEHHPHFWRPAGAGGSGAPHDASAYRQRLAFGEASLALAAPVWVSHAEASAYARFRGRALPTEAEWHRAAFGTRDPAGGGSERIYPWGDAPPGPVHGNFGFQGWDPQPADAHAAGASAFGVEDLVGNGWEWTSTPFAPFEGFVPYPFYPGYSADFFDGRHFVLKGGSPRTAVRLLRRSFRNWFQPHHPYVFAGFRCVDR